MYYRAIPRLPNYVDPQLFNLPPDKAQSHAPEFVRTRLKMPWICQTAIIESSMSNMLLKFGSKTPSKKVRKVGPKVSDLTAVAWAY